ncbi:MAG: hypothetical protein KQH57_14000 [Actinomycetales bacterium]|nr:hypothetical protein [Actinomycetales bacterium]
MSTPPPADQGPTRPGAPPRGLTPFVVVIGIAVLVVTVTMLARRDGGTPAPEPSATTTSIGPGQVRGPVAIDSAVTDGTTLWLQVASCHGDPGVSVLEETGSQVRVQVTSTVTDPGDACLDDVTVDLSAPFGDRRLFDLRDGADRAREVPVTTGPIP